MTSIQLPAWADFRDAIQEIERKRDEKKNTLNRRFHGLLFRGVGDGRWGLETTLERSFPMERSNGDLGLLNYYKKVMTTRSGIETLTQTRWDGLPTVADFKKLVTDDPTTWLDEVMWKHTKVSEYLAYLRHHGFPSPLLDWTSSPYVAAYFAFDTPPSGASNVSIYVLLRDFANVAWADAHLFQIGSYLSPHWRHFLQQCQYTMCVARSFDSSSVDWSFIPHDQGLKDALGSKGEAFKIDIPIAERLNALRDLDSMNINAYSLFGSEDSLVKAIARRECLFQEW